MKLIVGIDESNGEDHSCVACLCSRCNHVISITTIDRGEPIAIPYHKTCPHCGVGFDEYKVL